MYAGKCPKCETSVTIKFRGISAKKHGGMGNIPAVAYSCSRCDTILGVDTDPIALKNDIVNAIKRR